MGMQKKLRQQIIIFYIKNTSFNTSLYIRYHMKSSIPIFSSTLIK